jgi:hypothetical protein
VAQYAPNTTATARKNPGVGRQRRRFFTTLFIIETHLTRTEGILPPAATLLPRHGGRFHRQAEGASL